MGHKGSWQRPGAGFDEGWERIYGGKNKAEPVVAAEPEACISAVPAEPAGQHDADPVPEVNSRNGCTSTTWLRKLPDGRHKLYTKDPARDEQQDIADAALCKHIRALLALDAAGALVPHGIGGHARELLEQAATRLAGAAKGGQE